jgi:hypothetical protein
LAERLIEELSVQRGETIVPSAATSANALGLTTQVPVRTIYLTSGKTRKLTLGKQVIELQHAPSWQLTFAKEPAGEKRRRHANMSKAGLISSMKDETRLWH